ncbi:sterol desaturase family protein [Polyangium spumosum]|uniref:Beta-carotene hydroxylase n=1 Tax=Polyangium spumosum TaxID=889282 RepID=A0A6N7PVX9_9BACT|nr:sterol desaturase family protein [Polyangium spumosum]MRG94234.1 beta-carotene hydroxylase [Polyangium spumosum]
MSSALVWIPVALAVAAGMELWAMLLHGRVWHSLLWRLHRSHHRKRRGLLEANDALSVLHAPIAIAAILHGCVAAPSLVREVVFGVGIGMTLFGAAYLVVHDGLVHGRLPVQALAKIPYFARVRDAHLVHHAKGARGPYGLFLGPWELAWHTRKSGRPSS